MTHTLPIPDATAKAHSERVVQMIAAEIAQQGPIPFAEFMRLVLYAPGLGYYSAGARKFGEAGDFVTAPEISPLFSRCVARQCAEVLQAINNGVILELGAGTGKMARDILLELQQLNQLPQHYYILEVSADLRERQQQLFADSPELLQRVTWLDELPQSINGIILANEVIDAMPVHKFKKNDDLQEYYVDYQDGKFCWHIDAVSAEALSARINQLAMDSLVDYESEINLLLPAWMKSLAHTLEQGVMLFLDYGFPRAEYYHHDRHMGTLMCHYRHRAHSDPLIYPGIQDITAHVDFTAVAQAAVDNGLEVLGFTHQAGFLLGCGIAEMLQEISDEAKLFNANQQVKRLTLPSEMGELFKVIALGKNFDNSLQGFSLFDQLERL